MRTCVFLLLAHLTGCLSAELAAPGSWGGGSMSRGGAVREGSTTYSIVHLSRDDRVYFVMLREGSSGGPVHSGTGAKGAFRKSEGTAEWEVHTRTGRTGRVTLDGQSFQLEAGAVFLVNARDSALTVKQVKIDLDAFNAGNWSVDDRLRRLGESNATVRDFLAFCETPK